jgi:signal transduction histidine kinase
LAQLSIPVAVSIYLGYDFALTTRSLQQKLAEIEKLSREKLEMEKKRQAAQIEAMVSTQEQERKRISRDLHDDVGTKLSALNLFLSSLDERQKVQTTMK